MNIPLIQVFLQTLPLLLCSHGSFQKDSTHLLNIYQLIIYYVSSAALTEHSPFCSLYLILITWREPCQWSGRAHPFPWLRNTPPHCCSSFTHIALTDCLVVFSWLHPQTSSYGVRTSVGYLEMKSLGQRSNRRWKALFFIQVFNFILEYSWFTVLC